MKKYYTMDKSDWGDGPWQKEPDKVSWTDQKTGYPCLIIREKYKRFLCGYVGIDKSHPGFEKPYNHFMFSGILVRNSFQCAITYSKECEQGAEEDSICHIPESGKEDHVWWIGFDNMGVYKNLAPTPLLSKWRDLGIGDYQDINYIKSEVEKLAKQLYDIRNAA